MWSPNAATLVQALPAPSRPRPEIAQRLRGCFGDPNPDDVLDVAKFGPCPALLTGIPGLLGWFSIADTEVSDGEGMYYGAFYVLTRAWGWRAEIWSQQTAPRYAWDSQRPEHWPARPVRVAIIGDYLPNCEEADAAMARQWVNLAVEGKRPNTDPARPLRGQRWL